MRLMRRWGAARSPRAAPGIGTVERHGKRGGNFSDFARRGSLAQPGLTAYQRHKETTQKDRGSDS